MNLLEQSASFLLNNCPTPKALLLGCPVALLWAALCLLVAGICRNRLKLKTGYTRKVFHFLIFATVVAVHGLWKTPGVCLFGGMTSLVIAYALLRGPGNIMYEAMARESDAPHRTYYIIIPYLATLVGGLLNNAFFPTTALLGYVVTGLGDAVAEPVGTKFGKHRYTVPAFRGVKATRSVEGSLAVFLASALALAVCFAIFPQFDLSGQAIVAIILISSVSTAVEAVSPHGWDNATLQVIPALLGTILNVARS